MKHFILAFCLLAIIPFQTQAAENDAPKARAMLVFDASGSMRGQIDGTEKIVIARDVIGSLMKDWDEDVHLGLSAYGHRQGNCKDIETLVKIGPGTSQKIAKSVNDLKPKGKTPLSAAVKKAAEELNYTKSPATVILLSDGIETCDLDPCVIGKSLEENGIDFTAHVIGFDVKLEDQAGLKCLAENTGGKFLSAENAGALKEALQQVAKEVRRGPDRVYVILDKKGERYKKDVTWHVFKIDENGKTVRGRIDARVDDFLALRQPPGRYLVRAGVGQALKGEKIIEIKEDETQEHDIDLRAGTFNLSGVMKEGAKFISRGTIYWNIYPYKPDGTISNSWAFGAAERKARAELPPGKYQIRGKYGNAFFRKDIESKAGETENIAANFKAGVVGLSGTQNGQTINRDITWYAYRLKEDGVPQKRYTASNIGKKVWFTLNEGKYRIRAEYNQQVAFSDLEIKAGENVEQVADFKSTK